MTKRLGRTKESWWDFHTPPSCSLKRMVVQRGSSLGWASTSSSVFVQHPTQECLCSFSGAFGFVYYALAVLGEETIYVTVVTRIIFPGAPSPVRVSLWVFSYPCVL